MTQEELTTETNRIGAIEFKGNGGSIDWKKSSWRPRSDFSYCCYYCTHKNDSSACRFRIQVRLQNSEFKYRYGKVPHSDHKGATFKRGLSVDEQSHFSPSKLKLQPAEALAKMSERGLLIDEENKQRVQTHFKRIRARLKLSGIAPGATNTWGGVQQRLDQRAYTCTLHAPFTIAARFWRIFLTRLRLLVCSASREHRGL